MSAPFVHIASNPQPRDPRDCRTEDELKQAFGEMSAETQEYERYVDSLRGGVPQVLSELRRTIARNQLDRLRRLGGA